MRVGGRLVEIDLRPIDSVLPHEETNQELSSKLAEQIRADGCQRDPIIVDTEESVILDGMHRLKSLKELGAHHILCQFVEYSSPEVKLGRWVRSLKGVESGRMMTLLKDLGMDRGTSFREALELIEARKTALAIITPGQSFVSSTGFKSLADSFELVRRVDSACRAAGAKQDLVGEEFLEASISDPSSVLILTPRVKKKEVVDAAKSGRLLPYKSTRHVIGLRTMGVNYPLSDLLEQRPSPDLRESRLGKISGSILNPPVTYLGRRYTERLLVVGRERSG